MQLISEVECEREILNFGDFFKSEIYWIIIFLIINYLEFGLLPCSQFLFFLLIDLRLCFQYCKQNVSIIQSINQSIDQSIRLLGTHYDNISIPPWLYLTGDDFYQSTNHLNFGYIELVGNICFIATDIRHFARLPI